MTQTLHPVVLSGGSGSRLWPLSREQYPKQLLSLVGERTLLQDTVCRLDGLESVGDPLVVCNEEYRFLVAEQLRQLGRQAMDIILEPTGRNTAPALALAALDILRREQDGLMLVMPADHLLQDQAAFHEAIRQAIVLADADHVVTFGIVPDRPETGYGYIRQGEGHAVAAFVEKPDQATAQQYLAAGEYLWNSGMFMMKASVWMNELRVQRPDIVAAVEQAFDHGSKDGDFYRVDKAAFNNCPSDSIDYAVMEKTARAVVVTLDAGWSDIGAWSSLWEISERDGTGNVVMGDVVTHNTHNSLLISQSRYLATVGIDNAIVIETPDAVLVANKDSAQDVKEIVNRMKLDERSEYQTHRRVYRPWGSYEGLETGPRYQVKRLVVSPGEAISLQLHHHRAEHWVVVSGTARVTRGEDVFMLTENESTFIPIGAKHRLENPGTIPLEIIEVQSGSYLGEDDIVRFEDKYNRGNDK